MTPRPFPSRWLAIALAVCGLALLYLQPLRTGFLNDDYLFLEEARTHPLAESLQGTGTLGNYYRPLSRQVYFAVLGPIAGGSPAVFHAVNFAIFLVALGLLFELLLVHLPLAGAMGGTLWFALLPFQRVNLTWVSCSQDLLALAGTLAALALHRRGRTAWALAAAALAFTSKESSLPLPVALAAWDRLVEGRTPRETLRRTAPFWALAILWGVVAIVMAAHPGATPLHFDAAHLGAAWVHLVQTLLGIDHPAGWAQALIAHVPAILPLLLLAALAAWLPARADAHAPGTPARGLIAFAVMWLAAFAAVTAPAASAWSAYYYTLAAAGGAWLVALALRRLDHWLWVALVAVLLWWHAAGSATRAISVDENPWNWTSHLTSGYFERAAALTDSLGRQLRRLEPAPPHGTRLFFATLPPFAGFQMGNGAQVRALYRDSSLASYFYSRFSDSTAAGRPARFFYWNGVELTALYDRAHDPFFQVGTDLLLLDRPEGAEHAFLRGLSEGGNRMDHLYWLGWAEYRLGRRAAAEAAWTRFGAVDDSLYWIAHLRAAHNALTDGDTIEARRHLATAIGYGVGRPEAHAVLGDLLMAKDPKYGMLELGVAALLSPRDWMTRRELLRSLVAARLDEPARREFAALQAMLPEWRGDSTIVRAGRALNARRPNGSVVEF